jgi:GT2 family glycosyltransferase
MFSVVICTRNLDPVVDAERMYASRLGGMLEDVILIRDAAGLAEGYNRGLDASRAEFVIFAHDDVELLSPRLGKSLAGHMSKCDVLGIAGTNRLSGPKWWGGSGFPHVFGQWAYPNPRTGMLDIVVWPVPRRHCPGMQALEGCFLCVRRGVAQSLRFEAETFKGFHLYDLDFTFRAYLKGYRVSVATDLVPIHASGGSFDDQWTADAERFVARYRGVLAPPLGRPFRSASTAVSTREELIEVMTQPYWEPED